MQHIRFSDSIAPVAAHARTLYGVDSDGRLVTFADKQTKVKVKAKKGKPVAKGKGARKPAIKPQKR